MSELTPAKPDFTRAAPAKSGSTRKLSPINQRRLQNFRTNKRGYWSLWLFLLLFLLSLFAELIANDKPLLLKYEGSYYWPVVIDYTELEFGGEFDSLADYKDPYIEELIAGKRGWMLWPPIRFNYRTINQELPVPAPSPPSSGNQSKYVPPAKTTISSMANRKLGIA